MVRSTTGSWSRRCPTASRRLSLGICTTACPGPCDTGVPTRAKSALTTASGVTQAASAQKRAKSSTRPSAEPELIWRGGTTDGTPGHPALFPRDLWDDLQAVTGDEGGRSVLKRHADRVRTVPLPGRMAVLDLDTPEDWAAYLGRPGPSA